MPTKRKIEDSELDQWVRPTVDREAYGAHVRLRARHFCFVLYRTAHLCKRFQPAKPYNKYLTDIADVQVGQGVYATDKVDAAHLCNTSFLSDLFLGDLAPHPVPSSVREFATDLRRLSGATTPQFKVDNVGPDKVIDSFQTSYKNEWLGQVHKTQAIQDGTKLYVDFVTKLDLALSKSKSKSFTNASASGHNAAKKAKVEMTALVGAGVPWDVDNEFKEIALEVAKL